MPTCAIDIHHHYVPERVIGEAKQHGKALGIEVFEDNDGAIRFSFNGGPRYPLLQGLTDVEPRLQIMETGKIHWRYSIRARNSWARSACVWSAAIPPTQPFLSVF